MLCDECKLKPASVHVTKIINNQKTERHLCEDCASKEPHINFGIQPDFSVHQFLSNLLNYEQPSKFNMPLRQQEQCKTCGLTYNQFVHAGKMGCSDCYNTFRPQIGNLLNKIHGTSEHLGKVPKRSGGKYRLQREIAQFRQQLSEHIRNEEFEAAAEIRDKIKLLENEINS